MDPITFGLVAIGAFGGGLLGITFLEHLGVKINDTAIKIVMEAIKTGGLLYLLEHLSKLFF